eukprot:68926-Rhodomonas_salina.1
MAGLAADAGEGAGDARNQRDQHHNPAAPARSSSTAQGQGQAKEKGGEESRGEAQRNPSRHQGSTLRVFVPGPAAPAARLGRACRARGSLPPHFALLLPHPQHELA